MFRPVAAVRYGNKCDLFYSFFIPTWGNRGLTYGVPARPVLPRCVQSQISLLLPIFLNGVSSYTHKFLIEIRALHCSVYFDLHLHYNDLDFDCEILCYVLPVYLSHNTYSVSQSFCFLNSCVFFSVIFCFVVWSAGSVSTEYTWIASCLFLFISIDHRWPYFNFSVFGTGSIHCSLYFWPWQSFSLNQFSPVWFWHKP